MWRGETKERADPSLSQEKKLIMGNAKKVEICQINFKGLLIR